MWAASLSETDNSLKVPAYQLYGLGARYQRTLGDKAFTLRLNIDNLLDEDYWITRQAVITSFPQARPEA